MKIKGFQKLTLIDYPGKVASTIFLFGCNFKCSFCHNPELVLNDQGKNIPDISEQEILDYLKQNVAFIEAVCITGGEPLLFPELKDFISKIYELGYSIKVDTNGTNPEYLKELLQDKKVEFVAMDIKSAIEKERYKQFVNVDVNIEDIKKSINLVKQFPEYEFRITIAPGINKDDILKISEYLKSVEANKIFVLQQFRPDKCLNKDFEKFPKTSDKIMQEFANIAKPYFNKVVVRKE